MEQEKDEREKMMRDLSQELRSLRAKFELLSIASQSTTETIEDGTIRTIAYEALVQIDKVTNLADMLDAI